MNYKCCICGKECIGYGNHPYPIKNEGLCCDTCYMQVIIKKCIELLNKGETKND